VRLELKLWESPYIALVFLVPSTLLVVVYTLWVSRMGTCIEEIQTRAGNGRASLSSIEIHNLQGTLRGYDKRTQGKYSLDHMQLENDRGCACLRGLRIDLPPSTPFLDFTPLQYFWEQNWIGSSRKRDLGGREVLACPTEGRGRRPVRVSEGLGGAQQALQGTSVGSTEKPGWNTPADATLLEVSDLRLQGGFPDESAWYLSIGKIEVKHGKILMFRTSTFLECRMKDIEAEFPWQGSRVTVQAPKGESRGGFHRITLEGGVVIRSAGKGLIRIPRLIWDLQKQTFIANDGYRVEALEGDSTGRRGVFDYSLRLLDAS